MEQINKISKKYNLIVVEDAAQAMGAFFNNKHAGNFSDIAAFSSHPLKNLNAAGDGGFIVTNNKKLYDKIALYRNHGLKSRDQVEIFGVNSRLDVLNAEILKFRLKKLKNIILRRTKNVSIYKKYIQTNKLILPIEDPNITHSYVMLLALCENRNELQKHFEQHRQELLNLEPDELLRRLVKSYDSTDVILEGYELVANISEGHGIAIAGIIRLREALMDSVEWITNNLVEEEPTEEEL
jgi:dTDP-4-amino-4,6-dideoxygalactose transaminase